MPRTARGTPTTKGAGHHGRTAGPAGPVERARHAQCLRATRRPPAPVVFALSRQPRDERVARRSGPGPVQDSRPATGSRPGRGPLEPAVEHHVARHAHDDVWPPAGGPRPTRRAATRTARPCRAGQRDPSSPRHSSNTRHPRVPEARIRWSIRPTRQAGSTGAARAPSVGSWARGLGEGRESGRSRGRGGHGGWTCCRTTCSPAGRTPRSPRGTVGCPARGRAAPTRSDRSPSAPTRAPRRTARAGGARPRARSRARPRGHPRAVHHRRASTSDG